MQEEIGDNEDAVDDEFGEDENSVLLVSVFMICARARFRKKIEQGDLAVTGHFVNEENDCTGGEFP